MAEIAGLVVGASALAALYSTCVDLFDTFDLHRHFVRDYHLAATKIDLLRERLRHWGVQLQVDHPGREAPRLRLHWCEEKEVVGRTLQGIAGLLADASRLGAKHRPQSSDTRRWSHRFLVRSLAVVSTTGAAPCTTTSTWSGRIHRRVTWAVRDKIKTDTLIADLSFLVDNLERVLQRLEMGGKSGVGADPGASRGGASTHAENMPVRTSSVSQPRSRGQAAAPLSASESTSGSSTDRIPMMSAEQRNKGHSTGVIGSVGNNQTSSTIKKAHQDNYEDSFGVIGTVSAEAAHMLRRATERALGDPGRREAAPLSEVNQNSKP